MLPARASSCRDRAYRASSNVAVKSWCLRSGVPVRPMHAECSTAEGYRTLLREQHVPFVVSQVVQCSGRRQRCTRSTVVRRWHRHCEVRCALRSACENERPRDGLHGRRRDAERRARPRARVEKTRSSRARPSSTSLCALAGANTGPVHADRFVQLGRIYPHAARLAADSCVSSLATGARS